MSNDVLPGLTELIEKCPHMRRIHSSYGAPASRKTDQGFETLLHIIVGQQVSTQSAAAIWKRAQDFYGDLTPENILAAGEDGLRSCGFSRPKIKYSLGLADAVKDGSLDLKGLGAMDDDLVMATLMALKGIGRWSAEIYLMFALGRPDVWPAGDIAVAAAAADILGLENRPGPDAMYELSEQWKPWRSTAALMLWHHYHHMKSNGGGQPLAT